MTKTAPARKRLLIVAATLATVVLLVLVALYAVVMTVDIANYRGQVETLLSQSLEREVKMGGTIRLERSLNPRVIVDNITVANPSWASRPSLATIKQLQLRIALWPLLVQRLQIIEFKLVGADILLERRRDGTPNWILGARNGGAEESEIVAEVLSLGMQHSKVTYRVPDGSQLQLGIDDLRTELAPGRPLRVRLKARTEDVPVVIVLDGDTPEALLSPTQAWRFRGSVASGDFHADVSGNAYDLLRLSGVEMDLRYYGTRSGVLRSFVTRQIPKFAEYRGEAHFKSESTGLSFEVNAEGSDAELSRLWGNGDEVSPLAINMRHLTIRGHSTAPSLPMLLTRSSWELAAQDAELRWQYPEREPSTVIERATVAAAVRPGQPIEVRVQGRHRDRTVTARGTLGSIEALLASKAAWRIDAEMESDWLSGKVARDPEHLQFSDLQFALGESWLQGNLAWSDKASPRLHVALAPSVIRFEDLRHTFGPVSARRTESKESKDGMAIPAIPLTGEWMRAADADLSLDDVKFFDADRVLVALNGELRLVNGRLEVNNLRSAASGAPTVVNMTIDARRDPAEVNAVIDAKSIDYGALLKATGVADGFEGTLALHVRIAGQGNDLRALLRDAKGRVEILGGEGRLQGRVIELWAGNVLQILNPVSWAEGTDTELKCVAASFNIGSGVARSELLLLDSRNVTVAGELVIDLATERMKGLFKPQQKKASLMKLGTPIRLSGTLSHPKVAATERTIIALGKLVVGIAQPAALIVLFGDLGAKEKNPCAALLARQGAEVVKPGPSAP